MATAVRYAGVFDLAEKPDYDDERFTKPFLSNTKVDKTIHHDFNETVSLDISHVFFLLNVFT